MFWNVKIKEGLDYEGLYMKIINYSIYCHDGARNHLENKIIYKNDS